MPRSRRGFSWLIFSHYVYAVGCQETADWMPHGKVHRADGISQSTPIKSMPSNGINPSTSVSGSYSRILICIPDFQSTPVARLPGWSFPLLQAKTSIRATLLQTLLWFDQEMFCVFLFLYFFLRPAVLSSVISPAGRSDQRGVAGIRPEGGEFKIVFVQTSATSAANDIWNIQRYGNWTDRKEFNF